MQRVELFPARDLRVVFGLRWKQFLNNAVYWFRLLGYQQGENSFLQKVYIAYLLGIGSIWGFAMWAWGFDISTRIGESLAGQTLGELLVMIPPVVLAVQIFAMVIALRSTPLKLSFSDMAYVAGSPIARSVPVLLGFIRQVLLRIVLFGALWTLITIVLLGPVRGEATPGDSLRVAGVVALMVVFTWATAWLLGILRLVFPQVSKIPLLWALPLLLLPLAYLMPDAFLWPGRTLVLVVYGLNPVWLVPFVALLAAGLTLAFVWMGNRINMIQAVDESVVYARLAALGILAWRMPDLQLRIRAQESHAGRKPRFSLPQSQGQMALVTRSLVSYIRHPSMLLVNVLWGAAMAYIAVLILTNGLPVQIWIGWLLVAGITPPIGLLHTFRMDVREPFLRQFLPLNGFQILLADIVLPLVFLIGGALVIWLLAGFSFDVLTFGILLIPPLGLLLALCGAVAMTSERELQTRLLATGASFGLSIVATVLLGSPFAGLGVVFLWILILSGMLVQNA